MSIIITITVVIYNYITITFYFKRARHKIIVHVDQFFSRENVNGISIKNIFSIFV